MISKTDFMCVCTPDAQTEAVACFARVLEKLDAKPEDFLSSVVVDLQWALTPEEAEGEEAHAYGYLDSIHWDQWGLVSVVVKGHSGEKGAKYEQIGYASVQCDRAEHGLARAWELACEIVEEWREGTE